MTNYIWTVSGGGSITAGGTTSSNTVTITWNTAGAQTVSVNYTNGNGCTAAAPFVFNVTVNALPIPTIAGPTPVCVSSTGNVYTTQASMTNYIWSVSAGGSITAGGTATSNTVTVTWNTAGAQTVSVNYTNGNGCTAVSPTVYNVTVNPLPVPTISGPTPVCVNSAGNVYTTQGGMTNYIWSVSSGGTITAGGGAANNTVTVTWTSSGAKTVSVNYTNGNGCTAASPTIYNVTVNPLPVPTISGPASVCVNSTGNIYSTQPAMTNYIWAVSAGGTVTAGGTATDNTVTVTWNTVGAQSVSVNYTNANGCTAASPTVYPVTVNPLPAPTVSGPGLVCNLSTNNIYTTQGGMSGYTWTVTGGTITSGNGTASITVTWNVSGSQTVSVNYQNSFGCYSGTPGSMTVIVIPLPTPTITGPNDICAGSTGNVYTTESGMTNYTWTVSAGGTITAGGGLTDNTVTVTWNSAGAQTVTVTYLNAFGCAAATPTVYPVTVNPRAVPTISGPASVCLNSTGNVYTTESGNSNYIWSVSAGGTITAGGGAANNTVTITWIATGAQTVSVSYTNAFGCTTVTPTVYNITVNALPTPSLSGPSPVCAGSTGNIYTTDAGQSNYLWTVSAGGTITAGGGTANNTATVTWNTVGSQSISVNYTNSNGCSAGLPTVKNVTVNALPIPTIAGPTPVCAGTTGNVYTTQGGNSNYIWSVSAGGTITAGGTTNSSTVTVTWNTAGAQTVSVNYTNGSSCTAAAPFVFNVTVNALPTPTIIGPSSVCATSTGNVYITETGMTNYVWSVSAGGTITAGGGAGNSFVAITWNTPGAQTVSVNYTNANGCTAAAPTVFNVTVNALPVPTISGPTPVCVISTGNVYTTQAGMTNYIWLVSAGGTITAGGTTNSNTVTVTWNITGAQTVSVNYTNSNGCTAAAPTVFNVTANPTPAPTLSGPTPVCAGTTGNVYTTQAGMTNYTWAVSAGGTITAGGTTNSSTVTVTWNTAGAQTVSVDYTNSSGCTAPSPTVFNVTVNALPTPTIAGPTPVCATSAGNVYTTQAGMTNYIWAVSAGGTITAGGTTNSNTVTVTWNTAGAQTVSVNYTNGAGCTAAAPFVYNVTVNALPVPTIAGPTPVCVTSTGNVYTTQGGMTNYLWSVSAGGTITAGGTTNSNSVTVTWNTVGAQTVSVNYTNSNGCTALSPTVFPVTVNALPVPTIAGPTPVCVTSTGNVYTTQAGMTNYIWSVSAGGTITAGGTTNSNTVTITWNTVGAQTVSVNYTNANGCTAAAPVVYNVTVNALPVPTIAGPTPVCVGIAGNVYTTQPGNTNYIWSVSAGGTITAGGTTNSNTITITWNTAGAQTVSVNYTNSNGCTAAAPFVYNVTVNALPVPTLAGPTPVCAGTAGNVYTTQAGMTNYIWAVSAGGTITAGGTTNSNTVTITWNTAGAQTVSVNYTNANGCTAVAPVVYNVTVNALPVPTIAGPASVCVNSTGNVYTTQAGMTNYLWTVSAGGTITAGGTTNSNTVTVTWTTVGAQTVRVNYTNANGCTAAAQTVYNVTVNALPVPTLAGPTPVCVGIAGNVYTTQAGMTNYIWAVSAGGTITAGGTTNSNTVTITWTTVGAQTVSVNYTNANGCTAVAPVVYNVTVNALPVPTLAGPTPICAGTTGNVYTTQAGMTNYIWAVSAGGTITAGGTTNSNTVTVTWNTAGAQTVSVNYTNANGCTAVAPVVYNVTVNPLPVVTIAGPTPVCATTTGNVYTTQAGMTNYIWAVSAGGTVTAGGTPTSNTVTITWNTAGAQTISVNYTNANGCTAAAPTVFNVTVNALPTPTITGPASVCINSTGNVYTTQAGNSNYVWSVSPGGIVTAGGGSASNTVTVTWITLGAQFVGVNYTNVNGCTAPVATTYNVTVNPLPVPTLTGPNPVCVGSTGNVYTTQAGMTNYIWAVSAGGTITAGGTSASNTVTVTWNTAGAQTVSVNYSNSFGCTAAAPIVYNVTVNGLPVPTITGPTPICVGTTGNVYTTQPGMTNYTWSVSAGGTITAGGGTASNTVTVTWNTAGAQTVSVNYTNAGGCTALAPVVYNVTVSAVPVPTLTGATSMCVNSGYYNYTTDPGMQNYVWTVSSGGVINYGSGTYQIQVSWIIGGAQTVSVTYTNGAGCIPAAPTVLNVTVNPVPDPAGAITGTATVCAGTNGVTYSVAPIPNATAYVWALPPNATIASGSGTNSITVNFATNATSGDIIVYGNNVCGNGPNSPPFAVTVNPLPGAAGTISGPADVCKGATGVVYSVASITNATGYSWTVPAGVTITSGNNSNTITCTFTPSAVSGNITVMGTNSCGDGTVSPNFAVTVNPIPPTPVVTNHGDTLISNIPNGNQWYFQGTMLSGATGQTYVATQEGYYWDIVTINGCSSDSSNHKLIRVTGIESHPASVINLYPVPNDGRFNIAITTVSEESFTIGVYNNLGVKIYETPKVIVNGSLIRVIDLRPAPNGMYTVIIMGDRETAIKKVIVNN
jgi:acetyl esterase/lipase